MTDRQAWTWAEVLNSNPRTEFKEHSWFMAGQVLTTLVEVGDTDKSIGLVDCNMDAGTLKLTIMED